MAIRLMIVDDHTLFREGVKALLSTLADIEVVGEASDGETALRAFPALQPAVVLMDIHMPGMHGIDVARQLIQLDPQLGVIMLTMLEDDASVFAAMRAGARGYVLKGANPQEMLSVIRAVAEGQALFGPAIAIRMARFFQEAAQPGVPSQAASVQSSIGVGGIEGETLTAREQEVLELIAAGYNNPEISTKLVISPKTVRNHITSIFAKLQVADRAQAIRRAAASRSPGDPQRKGPVLPRP
jgi:DNA-binding NarL/FixJ family response regulator